MLQKYSEHEYVYNVVLTRDCEQNVVVVLMNDHAFRLCDDSTVNIIGQKYCEHHVFYMSFYKLWSDNYMSNISLSVCEKLCC